MMTIHTSGGLEMIQASVDAVKDSNIKIFGVTALTSLSDEDVQIIYKCNAKDQVKAMIKLAVQKWKLTVWFARLMNLIWLVKNNHY